MSAFGSFWHGPRLSAFEAACLHSFVAAGHDVTLFSYAPVHGVPAGVHTAAADAIADRTLLGAFRVRGVPSLSHFSDAFRYRMLQRTSLTWIDADVLLLRGWTQDPAAPLLARETPQRLATAVLRIPSDAPWLAELAAQCEALAHQRLRWGDTGPRLLTRLAGGQPAAPVERYCPLHHDEFWKPLLPEHADECRERCRHARTLHLWNNLVDRLGYWKDWLPPAGSFLHERFVADRSAPLFRGEFPLSNLRQLIENWRARQTGQALGIGGVLRQVLPSVARSWRTHVG